MPLNVSYMGTKRKIAQRVARIVAQQPPGPLLEIFSGMCTVSTAVGQSRPIWCNDVQMFASTVAAAFFTSRPLSVGFECAATLALPHFRDNAALLRDRFARALNWEERALASGSVSRVRALEQRMPNVAGDDELELERVLLTARPSTMPYRMFSITYSGGYFGLDQCVEIDSIRFAIDRLLATRSIDANDHRWLCLGLCQAVSKVATTTGHFAQHMRANDRNIARYVAQRRRAVWPEWLRAVFDNHPVGTASWRARNRVYRRDAGPLLGDLQRGGVRPTVVYADPPYTRDQYSRYYHLYETLLRYDYPASRGSGRYRPDRFRSPYSMKTSVTHAIDGLVAACTALGSTLVLSYPERGMLPRSTEVIPDLIARHYGRPPRVYHVAASHSSFGASKGRQNYPVQERIYVAH